MPYKKWFLSIAKQATPQSEWMFYGKSLIFGLFVFAAVSGYIYWLGTPNLLNKAVADTAILLMGVSMMLSSLCYFWDFVDTKIVYRKHIGLVGFSFMILHLLLSVSALQKLLLANTWMLGLYSPVINGFLATVIFTIMALISNRYMATELGGKVWRGILRTGYVGVFFVVLHVFFLKSSRWMTWASEGFKTPPAMSLLVTVFMIVVLLMRVALWAALTRKRMQLR